MRRTGRAGGIACALSVLLSAPAPAETVSSSPTWVRLPRAAPGAAEVEGLPYAPAPTPRALDRRQRRGDPRVAARLARGPDPKDLRRVTALARRVRFVSRWLSAVSVEADAATLRQLRREFGADAVRPVARLRWTLPSGDGLLPPSRSKRAQPGLDYGASHAQLAQIQVDQLHALGASGAGVRVLVLDTGFWTEHAALGGIPVVDEWDFVFEDGETANEPGDVPGQHNHGTAVLGALAGYAPGDLVGAAYGVEVLLAKTEDVGSETQLEEDNFVAALEWGEALGADVATASLGYTAFDDGFAYPPEAFDGDTAVTSRAMDDVVALGVTACAAAGNRGPGPSTLTTPGDADSVITVGAVDSLDAVRNFSGRGPTYDGRIKPDVAARGFQTVASTADGGYALLSGTSMSTPLVAGAAALLLELHPGWTPLQVGDALRATASQAATPDNDLGHGVLRVFDAAFEVEEPVVPLPFHLLQPEDGAVTTGPVIFRWEHATDLQAPDALDYWIQFGADATFTETVGLWPAGPDTVRTLDFLPTGSFAWRVIAVDPEQHERATGSRAIETSTPLGTGTPPATVWARVGPPVPNPFNPAVRLRIELRRPSTLRVSIHDAAGREVRRLETRRLPAGEHSVSWEGRDDAGRDVSSGIYLARLHFVNDTKQALQLVRRLTLLR